MIIKSNLPMPQVLSEFITSIHNNLQAAKLIEKDNITLVITRPNIAKVSVNFAVESSNLVYKQHSMTYLDTFNDKTTKLLESSMLEQFEEQLERALFHSNFYIHGQIQPYELYI